jgi:hypothetical protein
MDFKMPFLREKCLLCDVKRTPNLIIFLFIFLTVINFTGCCVYSFTGASVPQHLKTIAIPIAEDRSGSGEPGLKELLTQQLIQKFINDNTLQVTEKVNADAELDCVILPLSDAPAVVSAGENVQTMKITINIQVTYKDLVQRKTIFDKKFSNFSNYPSGGTIDQRREAIQAAIDLITEDILLDTVSGW